MINLEIFLNNTKNLINEYSNNYIDKLNIPKELKDAIIYSLVNDGKKLRPSLFLAMLKNYGLNENDYLDIALAIELVHTYSLVHDDLPAMDNDDYRWGKHTNHVVFGEDIAILTGDAMQSLSYQILSSNKLLSGEKKISLINLLSDYSGVNGMLSGQIYDIKQCNYDVTPEYLKKMHSLKTGKLITLPLLFATIIADKKEEFNDLLKFGEELGIAYQIKDDILDYYGDFSIIGKKYSDENMTTYLSFYGIEKCEQLLKNHTENAKKIAKDLNNNFLISFAEYLLLRNK